MTAKPTSASNENAGYGLKTVSGLQGLHLPATDSSCPLKQLVGDRACCHDEGHSGDPPPQRTDRHEDPALPVALDARCPVFAHRH